MDTPFAFDKYVTGKYFVGRKTDCAALSGIISHGGNAVLWAPPKSGKKSLIQQSLFNMRTKGMPFSVCSLDMVNIREPQIFARRFAGELLKSVSSDPGKIAELSDSCLGHTSLVFDAAAYSETGEIFQGTFPISEEEYEAVMELPYTLALTNNISLVIILEEFQNIDSDEGERLFKVMERVMKRHRDGTGPFCSFVLTGSRVNAMADIFMRRRFFWNLVEFHQLSEISEPEISDHVLRGFNMGGKVLDRELLQGVVSLLKNNIWYVNHFFFICDSLSKGYISELTLNDALSCLVSVHVPRFLNTMNDLTDFQVRLLKAVLDGVVKFSTLEVIEKYALNSSANVKRLKDALMKKEVISFDAKDEPYLLDPLFEYWLRKFYFGI